MASSTTPKRAVKFSALEQQLIDLLPRDGRKVDSTFLVQHYYADEADPPLNARAIIIGRLRGIGNKAKVANVGWRLRKTKRAGPKPQSFWIEQA